eukprot:scaffold9067_cov60-Phaeocystis_antarctica.AAC.5
MDKLAVCERLQKEGSPHVGEATVFVSWFLNTPIATLLDALANFLKQKGLKEEATFFWVCDYVIRQTDVTNELEWLGECVSAVGHTVLLMESWNDPLPLKRAYCIKEVYHTQASGAEFDMVMSTELQGMDQLEEARTLFEEALQRGRRHWATDTRTRCARSATWPGCCRRWASWRRRGCYSKMSSYGAGRRLALTVGVGGIRAS